MTDKGINNARASEIFPAWLKKRIPAGTSGQKVRDILSDLRLHTVCRSALCPNIAECFHSGTATFLIMGPNCTRACRFCAVDKAAVAPIEPDEPERLARAVRAMALRHVVVTSVTRDDLADGGAGHFRRTIEAIRAVSDASIEVLVPDFGGRKESIDEVADARPDVFNHNVETAPRLYPAVRPQADYRRSVEVLRLAARPGGPVTKSGVMVGLGETIAEIREVFKDLRAAGVGIVTAGQYLAPSKRHFPVERFVTPEEFKALEADAAAMGFQAAYCGPLVRSSYHAAEVFGRGR